MDINEHGFGGHALDRSRVQNTRARTLHKDLLEDGHLLEAIGALRDIVAECSFCAIGWD